MEPYSIVLCKGTGPVDLMRSLPAPNIYEST